MLLVIGQVASFAAFCGVRPGRLGVGELNKGSRALVKASRGAPC